MIVAVNFVKCIKQKTFDGNHKCKMFCFKHSLLVWAGAVTQSTTILLQFRCNNCWGIINFKTLSI